MVINKRCSLFFGSSLENNANKMKYHVGSLSMDSFVLACARLSKSVVASEKFDQANFSESVLLDINRAFLIRKKQRISSFGASKDFFYHIDVSTSL